MQLTRRTDDPVSGDSTARRFGPSRRRVVFAWLLVAVWAAVIWRLGGDDFSARHTSPFLMEWFRWLFGEFDGRTQYRIILGIRKSAHLVEYAILAGLTFRAALVSAGRSQLATAAWIALFIVATLACADEARQALSPTRSGSPFDVLLDCIGGVVAIGGLLVIARRLRIETTGTTPAEST